MAGDQNRPAVAAPGVGLERSLDHQGDDQQQPAGPDQCGEGRGQTGNRPLPSPSRRERPHADCEKEALGVEPDEEEGDWRHRQV